MIPVKTASTTESDTSEFGSERRQRHQSCADHGAGGSIRIYNKVARGAKDRIDQ